MVGAMGSENGMLAIMRTSHFCWFDQQWSSNEDDPCIHLILFLSHSDSMYVYAGIYFLGRP
jgi:hypothetical protein